MCYSNPGDWLYYHADGLGSIRHLSDSQGQIVAGYAYDPFGALRSAQGPATPFLFTGEQHDASTGLYYLRARYYDPITGRFMQRDPFPGLMGLPQTLNPYAYALNNPIRYTDPSGQIIINIIGGIIGAAVGGLVGAGAYALSVAAADGHIDSGDMLAVALTGAVAGGMIGSGVGILALIGAGGGMSGLGYLTANAVTGSQFCLTNFSRVHSQ